MATPNTVDIFSRFMARKFDEKAAAIGNSTAFQAFFGKDGSETVFSPDSNVVDIDIIRGNERTAALIPRGVVSRSLGSLQKNQNVEKYTSFSRKYPLAEEEGDITGDQILNRVAGEAPYNNAADRFDRMRILGLKVHMESVRRIVRLFERLAAQSALTGKQDAILGTSDTDLQYDFRRNTGLTVTPSNTWDSGSQDILGDIDGICDKIREYGKVQPNAMFLGGGAMDAFIKDLTIKDVADNRRFDLLTLDSVIPAGFERFTASGWNPRGVLRTPQGYLLYMFTNVDGYINEAGTFTQYMPTDQALITSTMARADRYFGPPETLPMVPQRAEFYREMFGMDPFAPMMPARVMNEGAIIDPGMFYCDAYASNDWKKVTLRTQSAPIFATTQTDAFGLLQNLLT